MAVSLIQRPKGIILGDCIAATIDQDYSGYATVNKISHGLTDNQYVYVTSNIEDYNGFFPVEVIDGHHFFLLEYEDGPRITYLFDADITYCQESSNHGWCAVHLPIMYKLKSTLWPVNTVDTARTVSSFTDDNGYTNLNLSGALKATFFTYDYVKISGAVDASLNGIFQIRNKVSTSDVTIELAYDSGYSFAGATVQFYYNNYHFSVKIYGGISTDHELYAFKPIELLTTLNLTPDSTGIVKFSINEILKSKISIKNNLLLATLPNNIDAWTNFYINYAEEYDQSDGDEVAVYNAGYTSDVLVDSWTPESLTALASWSENGTGEEWSDTSTPTVSLSGNQSSENKYADFAFVADDTYRITYSFNYTKTSGANASSRKLIIYIKDSGDGILLTKEVTISFAANTTGTWTFIAPTGAARITVVAVQTAVFSVGDYKINSLSLDSGGATGYLGSAINAQLPFKNQYSGFMSEYIKAKWLTLWDNPIVFNEDYFDLSAIVNQTGQVDVLINGSIYQSFANYDTGVYRIPIPYGSVDQVVQLQIAGENITNEITVSPDTECENQSIYLSWLNYLGGFDFWQFKAKKDFSIDIIESRTTVENIYPLWPDSYATAADTIEKEVSRTSRELITVTSQYLTLAQLQVIKLIKTSSLVQIVTSRSDRRTVILDADSFKVYNEADKLYTITFTLRYTNLIPSQTL
jgi:hypothetical protein